MVDIIPQATIQSKIFLIRGKKIMLDRDLAELYGVTTYGLKRAVRRNLPRFPVDFMFELTQQEYSALRRHFGALKRGGHSKYLPYAFTDYGILMLSSVLLRFRDLMDTDPPSLSLGKSRESDGGLYPLDLETSVNSQRAVRVNIEIMRTFTKLREMLASHKKLKQKIEEMEKNYDYQFKVVFKAIKELLEPPKKHKKLIGFRPH